MRLTALAASFLLLAVSTSAFAQQTRPAPPRGPVPPNAQQDAEPPLTPEQQANRAAVARYQNGLEAFLRASSSPRDQAMSVQVMHADDRDGPDPADAARGALLRQAAQAAPNDRLVQWTWAIAPEEVSGCTAASPCRDRGGALARLEPDNGAAWVAVVADGVRFNDNAKIDDALSHLAASTRYDEVFHDAMSAWLDAFRRHPIPAELLRQPDGRTGDATLAAGSFALAQVENASAPYDELVQACQQDRRAPATARAANCAKAGRLMLDRSTTIVGRMVGETLLRASGPPTPEDRERMRTAAWQLEQHARLTKGGGDPARDRERMDLLVGSESEVAAMQEELRRANVPLTPPAGWQPTRQQPPAGPPQRGGEDDDAMQDPSSH